MAVKPSTQDKSRTFSDVQSQNSGLVNLCLPFTLENQDAAQLERIIEQSPPLKKGGHLFHQGEPFTAIYAVRAGSIKTYTVTNAGEEQITGFYFPGEMIGLSAIDTDDYPISAKVLETTTVCEIPYDNFEQLSNRLPSLKTELIKCMGKELREEQQMMLLLSKKTAEERVATFLLKLSDRFKRRGYSASLFRLSMSRNEIGNYLGLAVETVSRIFSRFQKQQLIQVEGKEVELLDLDELRIVSGEARHDEPLIP
ncbi:fumarate/nitrate reduction transcriptional regulator Fnr [Motiliproteus sp.]|uniref:fumarate/nitrate reduction transcriptional regulator Fnr n=1 Tax=Motiliproteus sp. TaxID=1898955 RepID=UPI003BAC1007